MSDDRVSIEEIEQAITITAYGIWRQATKTTYVGIL
jgi:hypothetical protein